MSSLAFLSFMKYLTISVCSQRIARTNGVGPLIVGNLMLLDAGTGWITVVGKSWN